MWQSPYGIGTPSPSPRTIGPYTSAQESPLAHTAPLADHIELEQVHTWDIEVQGTNYKKLFNTVC